RLKRPDGAHLHELEEREKRRDQLAARPVLEQALELDVTVPQPLEDHRNPVGDRNPLADDLVRGFLRQAFQNLAERVDEIGELELVQARQLARLALTLLGTASKHVAVEDVAIGQLAGGRSKALVLLE